ncbi:chemotaxis protein [Xaviernesmea oryzae]|uniref:Chemotaxis protein n=1 Tax=Xaviernesmea oryzae TaxID=464029 RepID=A0A1Q9AZR0_9HYPH|nr:PAS domain-containing methyl-accepting chemotaxis protein [Xaviernesmea oryzae]OLP61212.1 chemotaxis protein [Xaviernesmea oryzae]SEL50512.1 methyl-accepting chemotaxis sensory transducer with Pas/Pac sensor [Xaviernesmea oryzae]
MTFFNSRAADAENLIEAIGRSQAMIEFDLEGKILHANENFCAVLGYSLAEIKGKHHGMFCDPAEVAAPAYSQFWQGLREGRFDAGIYRQFARDGREVWIQAAYNPVLKKGRPYKVVKIATDVTAAQARARDDAGKLVAISRSQAMIEFAPDGRILAANANFCAALGYRLEEIVGQHHSLFCRPEEVSDPAYKAFWQRLAAGEFVAGEFVRRAKDGREVWIQAAYNPILDVTGQVCKVVKFATDVSERMGAIAEIDQALAALARGELVALSGRRFVPSMEGLRASLNSTVDTLKRTVSAIGDRVASVTARTGELGNNSEAFSRRAEQQAGALEETAAALEEMTTLLGESSLRARDAGSLVAEAREETGRSAEIVARANKAMAEIKASSDAIGTIVSLIDNIAFQTNLLALNAGVEAARAGETGKGFAVVAQEVRELSQRSAKAAADIRQLITGSQRLVTQGVDLVDQAGAALTRIDGQVAAVDVNVSAIVTAAHEQASGLREISTAVNAIDQATQQNAIMAGDSSRACEVLMMETQGVREAIGFFREAGQHSRPTHAADGYRKAS